MAASSKETAATLHTALRHFTSQHSAASYKGEQDALAVTSSALLLLRQLPVARNAVLSYFGRRFDEAANCYLQHRVDKVTGNIYNNPGYNEQGVYDSLSPIAAGFADLTTNSAWAPQLSKWAIDLLGHISKKLSSSNAVPLIATTNTMEEKLELWKACSATKILIEITLNCFSVVVDKTVSVDTCVGGLLDAYMRYSPHFDWVVAHLGSCFPKTIIDRVLKAGYKEFISPGLQGSPKFSSAAAILGYLSTQHKTAARYCMVDYFKTALEAPPPAAATAAAYLLNTGSISPSILPILTSDIGVIFNPQVLNKLTVHYTSGISDFQSWQRKKASIFHLSHIIIYLLLRLEQACMPLINAIFDLASPHVLSDCHHPPLRTQVRTAAQVILSKFTDEMMKSTMCNRLNNKGLTDLPTLKCLILNYRALLQRLHNSKSRHDEAKLVCRLLLACGWQGGTTVALDILYHLLTLECDWVLRTFDEFLQQYSIRYDDIEMSLCSRIFVCKELDMAVLRNIRAYVDTESGTSDRLAQCLVYHHIHHLATVIPDTLSTDISCLSLFADLLSRHGHNTTSTLPVSQLLHWYFTCLRRGFSQEANKLANIISHSCTYSLSNLSQVLRELITMSMKTRTKRTVGESSQQVSLSAINSQLLGRLHLPPTKTYILHNECINSAKKNSTPPCQDAELVERQWVVQLAVRCCQVKASTFNTTDAKELFSRLILEVVSPDVIATKTLWHDPITHERELAVRRALDDNPFLWDLLGYVCTYKPCFVAISLLLRSQLATVCMAWAKAVGGPAVALPKELQATERVISFLVTADLIPAPLSYIGELFPHVACYEMKLLMDFVYRYLQASLQRGLSQDHLDEDDLKTLQSIVQNNISSISDKSVKFLQVE